MAGFMIGYALINPRGLTRRTALAVQGKKAVKIVLIGVLFLIPSALIESFFTPLEIPYEVKYLFAAGMAVLVIVYLLIGIRKDGRNRGPETENRLRKARSNGSRSCTP